MKGVSAKRACVIGWPIAQSRSPLIHGYWLNRYGIDGSYNKEAVAPDTLAEFLSQLEARGFAGCNVTVPHKEAAYLASTLRDPSAIAVGAANTLWLQDGVLACANTDTYGFMTNLDLSVPSWRQTDGSIVVLGAGGSARAVIYGFLQAGLSDIRVVNRSLERARELAAHFGEAVSAHGWASRQEHVAGASVIVNTTTLGMGNVGELGLDLSVAKADCVVADLVYVPLETQVMRQARMRGLMTVGGLGMLLHQAVPGFEKWFGVRPDVTDELYAMVAADIEGLPC